MFYEEGGPQCDTLGPYRARLFLEVEDLSKQEIKRVRRTKQSLSSGHYIVVVQVVCWPCSQSSLPTFLPPVYYSSK